MQVPERHIGLARIGVAASVVAVVADVAGVEDIEKAERPVVDGQAQDRQVVGVHHAMAKTHRLPLRHQARRGFAHGLQQRGIGLGCRATSGVELVDHKISQHAQRGMLVVMAEVLEVAKANEAGRHAGHHGGGFQRLAAHRQGRADEAQRARGGNAQAMHGLAAQKFADRRTQHRAAIAHARIGCEAAALELDFLPTLRRLHFTQQQGAAVAQLPRPLAELVPAVDAGQRLHAGPHRGAAEHVQGVPIGALPPILRPAQRLRAIVAHGHPVRLRHRLRRQRRVERSAQGGKAVGPVQVGAERGQARFNGSIHGRAV